MQRLSRWARIAGGSILLATAARAQTFLIDLGPESDVPFITYGAGADVPGYWYGEAGPFDVPQWLIDRWGFYTPVTLYAATAPPLLDGDDAATNGDDDALCDDGAQCGLVGDTDVWEFRNLAKGVYHVYTYVFSPNAPDDRVMVDVPGSIDPAVTIGGAWPGMHVEGITFSRHRLIITDGALDVRTTRTSAAATIDGFQIIRIDDSIDFGTSYCPANQNSTGSPAHLWVSGTLDSMRLRAEPLPEPGPALFFYGPTAIETPFGNGKLCVGKPQKRLGPPIPVSEHAATLTVDLTSTGLPSIHLQCWFRDPAGGGAFFNLSDALALP
jgi:hypothetical protein